VKSIVAKFPERIQRPKVSCSIAYIRSNFGWLLESIKRLETQGLPRQECMDIMINASEKLGVGESAATKLQAVLKRNSGFSTFTNVCQVLSADDVDPLKTLLLRKFLR
jgi:hypothetical protein